MKYNSKIPIASFFCLSAVLYLYTLKEFFPKGSTVLHNTRRLFFFFNSLLFLIKLAWILFETLYMTHLIHANTMKWQLYFDLKYI